MRRFTYQRRPPEALQRRLGKYAFDEAFAKALRKAYKGNTEPLCELLRSQEPPLTDENLRPLANLIARRLQAKGRGRPRGPGFLNPVQKLEDLIAYQACKELDRLRRGSTERHDRSSDNRRR